MSSSKRPQSVGSSEALQEWGWKIEEPAPVNGSISSSKRPQNVGLSEDLQEWGQTIKFLVSETEKHVWPLTVYVSQFRSARGKDNTEETEGV